jgi:hypothetical protein
MSAEREVLPLQRLRPVGLPPTGTTLAELSERIARAWAESDNAFDRAEAAYPPGDDVLQAALIAGTACFQANPRYPDLFPQVVRFEDDLVHAAIDLFHGGTGTREH